MKRTLLIILVLSLVANYSLATQQKLSVLQIVEKCGKAVVLIATAGIENETIGLGSGFIVDPTGIIITNYHVIEGAYPAVVRLINGDLYEDISIIEVDERKDIAVIKIKGWGLPTLSFGDSDNVKTGEQIVVIGNPKGLENTVTDGLVSGIRDSGKGYAMHQISAPISPGSSGSPVFNLKGEVIGIATSSIVEGQNLNFSVPINYARGLVNSDVKMSLQQFAEKTKGEAKVSRSEATKNIKKVYFPPPGKVVIIPEPIRLILFDGLATGINKNNLSFEFTNYYYFPAQQNSHALFIFKVHNQGNLESYVFLQFLNSLDGKPVSLAKEVFIPANFHSVPQAGLSNSEDYYTFGYPLPPGEYILSMAITNKKAEVLGTQFIQFNLPNLQISSNQLETTPVFFVKKITRMSKPETVTNIHKNCFAYSVLKIEPNLSSVFSPGGKLDVFFYILGTRTDNRGMCRFI